MSLAVLCFLKVTAQTSHPSVNVTFITNIQINTENFISAKYVNLLIHSLMDGSLLN